MGIWLRTRQYAFTPHKPGHGSWHLRLIQALSEGQSELTVHSGLQFGGEPIIWGWQLHSQRSPTTLGKFEFGPQGFGSQGSTSSTIGSIAKFFSLEYAIFTNIMWLTQWLESAFCKRISNIPLKASASWDMIQNSAFGIYTTKSRAWIHTFEILTCFISWTFCICGAFRSACNIGISKVALYASTCGCTVSISTVGVWPAGRRSAWVNLLCSYSRRY